MLVKNNLENLSLPCKIEKVSRIVINSLSKDYESYNLKHKKVFKNNNFIDNEFNSFLIEVLKFLINNFKLNLITKSF